MGYFIFAHCSFMLIVVHTGEGSLQKRSVHDVASSSGFANVNPQTNYYYQGN